MKLLKLTIITAAILGMCGCKDDLTPVEVTETRRLTTFDEDSVLGMVMPAEWRRINAVEFRDFNYRFGKDGEVYLSLVNGSILDNMNRWMRQFGKEPLEDLSSLERMEILGTEGVLVEQQGSFQGMGGAEQEGMALLGAMVFSKGNLITIKMVGDAGEVRAQRENFLKYAKSLTWREGDE